MVQLPVIQKVTHPAPESTPTQTPPPSPQPPTKPPHAHVAVSARQPARARKKHTFSINKYFLLLIVSLLFVICGLSFLIYVEFYMQ